MSDQTVLTEPGCASAPNVHDQSLAHGRIGRLLFDIERARRGQGDRRHVRAALADCLRQPLLAHETAALYLGAPAVAFAINAAADAGGFTRALTTLDTRIARLTRRRIGIAEQRIHRRERPLTGEFDLFYGLTGLGAYWLRRAPRSAVFRDVLTYLVRLIEPLPGDDGRLPGWWTDRDPSGRRSAAFPGGHGNLGMAHGIGGPLALLSLATRAAVVVPGQLEAIARICEWLDGVRDDSGAGPRWPYWVTRACNKPGGAGPQGPRRPSWCYGTPGLARAQQLAGIALGDHSRQHLAERALLTCLSDTRQLGQIREAGLCHGAAGVLHTTARTAADAEPGMFRKHLNELRERVTAMPAEGHGDLLNGTPGRELALLTADTNTTASGWDTCLLTG